MLSKKDRIALLVIGISSGIAAVNGAAQWLRYDASHYAFAPFWALLIFTANDGVTWGTFLSMLCIVLWRKNNSALMGCSLSFAYVVRSFIETQYDIHEQFAPFSPTTRPWDIPLPEIASHLHLTLTELYVVGQVCWTMLCVTSGIIFLTYLKKYLQR